jgi:hypothetical protein
MVDLAKELAGFDAELEAAQRILAEAQNESTEAVEGAFARFADTSKTELAHLHHELARLASRVGELCSVLEGDPMGPLEEAINRAGTSDDLLAFLASNDLEQFFLPAKQQKAAVLLDLLERLSDVIGQEIAFPWLERALLDFDTQDRAVRDRAPQVLAALQEKVKGIGGPKGHLLEHLIRSLAVGYIKSDIVCDLRGFGRQMERHGFIVDCPSWSYRPVGCAWEGDKGAM